MDFSYLAGFIDGEGCITTPTRRNRTSVVLTVAQRGRPEVIVAIQQFLGFGFVTRDKHGTYRYRCSNARNLEQIFTGILPYSIVKKPEIEVAMKLLSLIGTRANRNPRQNDRELLATQIKALKRVRDDL